MTMTTAPDVNTAGSVSPGAGSRLQIPGMSGSLQIRAPAAGSQLDEPRSPHDLGNSDRSDRSDDDSEYSPQSGSDRDAVRARAVAAQEAVAFVSPVTIVKRGAWSPQEDEKLVHCVETMRPLKWVHVSAYMKTRTSKQCRERYHNYLKPSLNRAPISKEEGRIIEELVAVHGKRWAEISRQLPGRSDNAIKNWWNASVTRRRASQDTSAMLLQARHQASPQQPTPTPSSSQPPQRQPQQRQPQPQQQQQQPQPQQPQQQQPQLPLPPQQHAQQHLTVPTSSAPHASDDSDMSPRASASPPAPPPVSIVFNKPYMDAACRSPVTPSSAGSQSRAGPQRTRSVAHTPTLPYPCTTPRWPDPRPRMSVGSIPSVDSRSNSVVDEDGRSVSPNASPPGMHMAARPSMPEDPQFSGFWNRRVPDYRRPSDALRGDVTSLSQYSLSTSSNPNSRRSSLNPVVPAELARPHGQPAFEQAAPLHAAQQPPLQQVLQAPLGQLQPGANAIQVQNAFSPGSGSPRSAGSAEPQQSAAQPQAHESSQQPSPAPPRQGEPEPQQQERSQPPQNNRSSLARLSIANLTNPMPDN